MVSAFSGNRTSVPLFQEFNRRLPPFFIALMDRDGYIKKGSSIEKIGELQQLIMITIGGQDEYPDHHSRNVRGSGV
jgi:hypothetical protein